MSRAFRICAAVFLFLCGSTLATFLGLAAPFRSMMRQRYHLLAQPVAPRD